MARVALIMLSDYEFEHEAITLTPADFDVLAEFDVIGDAVEHLDFLVEAHKATWDPENDEH